MSEQEQFEAIKKSANSQERTLKKWIGNLTKDEGIIFVRTYKGEPRLIMSQITMKDLLVVMDHFLNKIAKYTDIEFGELLAHLAMLHYARTANSHSSNSDEED